VFLPYSRIALPRLERPDGSIRATGSTDPTGEVDWAGLADEVDGLVRQSPLQAVASVVAALIVATFLPSLHHGVELGWLFLVLAIEGVRLWISARRYYAPATRPLPWWRRAMGMLAAVHGLAWGGFLAAMVYMDVDLTHPALFLPWLAVTIAAVALGAASAWVAVSALIPLLLLPMAAPLVGVEAFDPVRGVGLGLFLIGALWAVYRLEALTHAAADARRQIAELEARYAAQAYLHSKDSDRAAAILGYINVAVAVVGRDGHLEQWNPLFAELIPALGAFDPAQDRVLLEAVLRRHYDQVGLSAAEAQARVDKTLAELAPGSGVAELKREFTAPNGRTVAVTGRRLPDDRWVLTLEDVSVARQAAADALLQASRRDPLTGLPNRVAFRRALDRTITRARQANQPVGIVVFNIGAFKDINDAFGARLGDEVLRHVAACLIAAKQEGETIGRIGSDEFAITVVTDVTKTSLAHRATTMLEAIRGRLPALPENMSLDAYAGATIFPYDDGESEVLLRSAGIALERARQEDGNGVAIFDRSMEAEQRARVAMIEDIRQDLNSQNFVYHYQPQIDLKTNELVGAEALLRWRHPERGWMSPDVFIPAAELSRLIIPLTERMIPEVCQQIVAWDRCGAPPLKVAINLSPIHLRKSDFPDLVRSMLDNSGIDPRRLEFEITESIMISDNEDARRTLSRLRDLGVCLAIDDFGTGYASIGYLRRIPVSKIKIDRSFVREAIADQGARTIVSAIAGLGHSFRVSVVAEGVETELHAREVTALGCDIGQGYHYAAALPADEFIQWSKARVAAPANPPLIKIA
jgi:diguanylate cyclase (GGDEF)-like protein